MIAVLLVIGMFSLAVLILVLFYAEGTRHEVELDEADDL